MRRLRALLLVAALAAALPSWAASLQFCDRAHPLSAREQDRLLRFSAIVKQVLDDSGRHVAIVSRSGLDLHRFGLRYSHAGVSLQASADARWSVRQLYYACDERRPRLYDQGLPGFVFGTDDAGLGYVSIVLLPAAESSALELSALDNARALSLLGADYSANAYPFSLRYQNCNQWVIELIAAAWGELPAGADLRERTQAWLAAERYAPANIEVGSRWLMFAAGFVRWLHTDDQPSEELLALRVRTSVPEAIEAFVHERLPAAERIELCHDEHRVVIHRGWSAIAEGCVAQPGDALVSLDD